jgi:DivIVA domain-containing protein
MLTPDDIQDATFGKPPIGKRGYKMEQVDAFLDELAATLRGAGDLTAADVRAVTFAKPPIGQRGYDEDEVDAFLDLAEAQLPEQRPGQQLQQLQQPPRPQPGPPQAEPAQPDATPPGMVAPKRRWWQR